MLGAHSGGFNTNTTEVALLGTFTTARPVVSPVFASYRWGRAGDLPVVGDWDGDGTWTLGLLRAGTRCP